MKRLFYVLYLPHRELQIHLDLMRVVCDPSVVSPAHLTVRGPYISEPLSDAIWKSAKSIKVKIEGAGEFFSPNQNTVFLKCSSDDLKRIWWKPQYKDFQPHITIYDGNSLDFGRRLLSTLCQYDLSFSFVADELSERESTGKQFPLGFNWIRYETLLKDIGESGFERKKVEQLNESDRLILIDKIAKHLEEVITNEKSRMLSVATDRMEVREVSPSERNRVFISHANPEDNEFARWLTLRLISEGYPVWCDLVRLKGGEDFWKDIEEAIRNRTAKFLYVLSKTSNTKEGPLQELSVAKAIARQNRLRDFVIPLHIDDLGHGQMNIELKRLNAVDFQTGWANGLKCLLDKFEEDSVEKNPSFNATAAAAWWRDQFSANAGIRQRPEEYLSNWFPIKALPDNIYYHLLSRPARANSDAGGAFEPAFPIASFGGGVFSFAKREDFESVPAEGLLIPDSHRFDTADFLAGKHGRTIANSRQARSAVVQLLSEAWRRMINNFSLAIHSMSSRNWCFYFVKDQVADDRLVFTGVNGEKAHRYVMGYRTIRGREDERKLRHWHFGLSARAFLHPLLGYSVTGHVLFSDDGRQVWASSDRLHRARMNQCRNWWNDDWRDRILATMSWLAQSKDHINIPVGRDSLIRVSTTPIMFSSDVSFIEPGDTLNLGQQSVSAEEEFDFESEGDQS